MRRGAAGTSGSDCHGHFLRQHDLQHDSVGGCAVHPHAMLGGDVHLHEESPEQVHQSNAGGDGAL